MFSGLWTLEGRNWRRSSTTTKPAILKVSSSYTFRVPDGSTVCLTEGDVLVLLNKLNKDWWQAKKIGDSENTKSFQVPTFYINELIGRRSVGPRNKDKGSIGNILFPYSLIVLLYCLLILKFSDADNDFLDLFRTPDLLNQLTKTFCINFTKNVQLKKYNLLAKPVDSSCQKCCLTSSL